MSLSGHIIPIHFGPCDGEALSSWLARLAISHHLTPSIFFRVSIRSQQDVFKQDIDIKCPRCVLEEISLLTGKSLNVVRQTTFMPTQDFLYLHNQASTALPRWIGPTYIRKNTGHHFGLKICPMCMRESPHIRILWRCTFFVVCPQHGIKMVDRCERCASPKSTRRIFAGIVDDHPDEALCYCHSCGWDYRQATLKTATSSEKDHVVVMIEALTKGFYETRILYVGYSHLFFAGIRLLMNGLLRLDAKGSGYREKNSELEFQSVTSILSIMERMFALLDDWPDALVEFSTKRHLGKSFWVRPREAAPYWLSLILKRHLNFEKYFPTVEEVKHASKWLQSQKTNITGKNIMAALGAKSPPRNFHSLSKSDHLSRKKLRCSMNYLELEKRCFRHATKFVALRTIVFAVIYMYTPLTKVEVVSLTRISNVNNVTAFSKLLLSIGFAESGSKIIESLWIRYRDYLVLRDTVDLSLSDRLFLSQSGNPMDESLAVKSLARLLL